MKKYLVFLLLALPLFAQNSRYDSVALGPRGPIPNATVAVCTQPANTTTTPCSPLANLCSSLTDATCTSPNPVTADSLGNYHFYGKPTQGPFTIQLYGPQVAAPVSIPDQTLGGSGSSISVISLNNIKLVDGVTIPTLSSAVTSCASHPCVIYDNHPETTSTNPLSGLVAGSEVYLGPDAQGNGTWFTTTQWIVPNKVRLHLGGARTNGIQAVAGFPASTPLIQLGPTSGLAFGTSIEDGVINCNGFASIGVYSNSINEQSGGEKLDIINCPTGGYQFEGTGVGQSAGNFYWHDIEVYPSTFGTASTYAGKIDGFALNNAQIGMMYNITFVGNSGALSTSAFIFEGLAGGTVASLHCEQAVTCYVLGDATSPVNAGTFIRLECGAAGITTCVSINASGGNINLLNVANLGGATNTLVDNIQGKTITASHIGFYMVGVASMLTSDPGVTSTLGALNVSNSLSAQERTALGAGASGATLCYADSTAHALKCSYNNGSFFNVPQLIGSGTATMTTAAITAGNCGTTVTVAATGVLTTDRITWSFNAAPAGSNAGLVAWPTANNVNFAYCPNSAETPAAATINWGVSR